MRMGEFCEKGERLGSWRGGMLRDRARQHLPSMVRERMATARYSVGRYYGIQVRVANHKPYVGSLVDR